MKNVIIFTDGASKGNPGPGGWGAVIKYEESNEVVKVVEIGGREKHTTNNRMELTAAIEASVFLKEKSPLDQSMVIYTDSRYLINGITKWVYSWEKRNWITQTKDPVLNKDLWEKLLELTRLRKISWQYVGGHIGVLGNERTDEIASKFADDETVELYKGSLADYGINISDLSAIEEKAKAKKSNSTHSRKKAYSYVSDVAGEIKTHATWGECEKRVKGAKGARFKKSLDINDERSIISGWLKR